MIDALYEEVIALCEIRGELDGVANAKIERRIEELMARIKDLEAQYE